MTKLTDSPGLTREEAELVKALFRVERAARQLQRWPGDTRPRQQLARALKAVDKAKENL